MVEDRTDVGVAQPNMMEQGMVIDDEEDVMMELLAENDGGATAGHEDMEMEWVVEASTDDDLIQPQKVEPSQIRGPCTKQVKIKKFFKSIPVTTGIGLDRMGRNGNRDGNRMMGMPGNSEMIGGPIGVKSDRKGVGIWKTNVKKSFKLKKTGAKSRNGKIKLMGARRDTLGNDSSQQGIDFYFGAKNWNKKLGNSHGSSNS